MVIPVPISMILVAAVGVVQGDHDQGYMVNGCPLAMNATRLGGSDNLPASYVGGTATECCQKCANITACTGFTFEENSKNCWLKNGVNTPQPCSGCLSGQYPPPPPPPPCKGRCPNILYLMSDDMRPQLGCYGHTYMKTPNLDKLSASALHFDFAYTQFAYCAPSRNSFLSGRRPERTRALNFLSTFRMAPGGSEWTTMPEFFKKHGYFTSSAGKIFHDGMDDPPSWTFPSNQTAWVSCGNGDVHGLNGNFCGVTANSSRPYTDEDLALYEGLKRLGIATTSGKPWWVSIGIHRPHTNYRVPVGFYGNEIYPIVNGVDPVLPPLHPYPPVNAPYMSGNWEGGDIKDSAHGCPDCIDPTNNTVEYRRWYYAAVSWADHSLGRALDALDALGPTVSSNTITVFHSDHGYQLGELNEWSKKTDTELATHIPLLIRVPWKTVSIGARTTVKMELVDMYRTLADLSELTNVAPVVESTVQGTSVAAVFDNPTELPPDLASKRAFSQIGRCVCGMYPNHSPNSTAKNVMECGGNACCRIPLAQFDFMGYSMRTTDARFTAWVPFDNQTLRVNWNKTIYMELYLLQNDTGRDFDYDGYSLNVAEMPAYRSEAEQMLDELRTAVQTWY